MGGRQGQTRVQIIRQGSRWWGRSKVKLGDQSTAQVRWHYPGSDTAQQCWGRSMVVRQGQSQAGKWVQGWGIDEGHAQVVAGDEHISDKAQAGTDGPGARSSWRPWAVGRGVGGGPRWGWSGPVRQMGAPRPWEGLTALKASGSYCMSPSSEVCSLMLLSSESISNL